MISLIILCILKTIQLETSSLINISSFITYSTIFQNTKNISFSLFNPRKNMIGHLEIQSNHITILSNMNNMTIYNENKDKVILLNDFQSIEFLMNCSNNIFIIPQKFKNNFDILSINNLTIIIISNNDFEELLNEIDIISTIFIYFNISQTYLFPYNFYIFSSLFIKSLFIFIYVKLLCTKNSDLCIKNKLKKISNLIIHLSSFFIIYIYFQNNYLSFESDFYFYIVFYYLCDFCHIFSKLFIFTLFIKLSYGENYLYQKKKPFNKIYLYIFTILEITLKNIFNKIQIFYPAIVILENSIMFFLCLYYYFINLKTIALFKGKFLINSKISLFSYFFHILEFKTKIMKNIIILIILYTYISIVFISFYYILLYDFNENILIIFFHIEWTITIISIIILFSSKKPILWNLDLNEINRIYLCYEKKYFKCKIHFNKMNNRKNIETNIDTPFLLISPFVNDNQFLFDNIKVGYRVKE